MRRLAQPAKSVTISFIVRFAEASKIVRIAFYAPLNAPDSDRPSGDRLMAKQIMAVLRGLGHDVKLVSRLRAWMRDPTELADLQRAAETERKAVAEGFAGWPPDLWFTYHLYYRAPDLLGPPLCAAFDLPYMAAEASFAPRRSAGEWAKAHALSVAALAQADLLFAMTERDRAGLEQCPCLRARIMPLAPFLSDTMSGDLPARIEPKPGLPVQLVTVAMMRAGDKFASYELLAKSLAQIGRAHV